MLNRDLMWGWRESLHFHDCQIVLFRGSENFREWVLFLIINRLGRPAYYSFKHMLTSRDHRLTDNETRSIIRLALRFNTQVDSRLERGFGNLLRG